MSAKFICDGCGKEEPAVPVRGGHEWGKPWSWFQRTDKNEKPQDACSRECVAKIAEKTGERIPIAPF